MSKIKANQLVKDAFLSTVMTFVIAGILYFTFINLAVLDPFEKAFKDFKFTDIFYSERFNSSKRSDNIVLVNVKHANRFELAQAIDKVNGNNPKALGVDIIFKDLKLAFTDSILKETLSRTPNLVLSYYKDGDSIVENHDYFNIPDASKGYINLDLEGQNTVVRDFLGYNKNLDAHSFSAELLLKSGQIDTDFIDQRLKKPIPINYIGGDDMFLSFDIEEVMASETIPAMKNAIVLLGYLGDENPEFDIEDKHFTPLNKAWVGRAVPDTYGVTIHANIMNMFLSKSLLYRAPNFIIYLIAIILCFGLTYVTMKLYLKNNFVFDIIQRPIQLVFSVLLLYLALLLLQTNIYLDVIPIILLCLLGLEMIDYYVYLVEYLNKKFGWQSMLLS
ncbi:MAG: CHASE2 domain-containing protein [Winogradskyella sp.]|uniref:CHASE2 domain-containing protein n=1 Tax=Winogradskyella sp. TaxID=1883156 RepID=UPI000F3CC8D4|nr:CHASE2 domain-containing protein [Winogradskyella sp.]RNC86709.1 MAG: CHASE2 domain-containing protein [Winogradskyella sp.]